MRSPARRPRTTDEFPTQGHVIDLAGLPVDATSWKWRLNDVGSKYALNWHRLPLNQEMLEATARYLADMIKSHAPGTVRIAFNTLQLLAHSKSFIRAKEESDIVPAVIISELRAYLPKDRHYKLSTIRAWYRGCADLGYNTFSPEVAFELDEYRIGGGLKGQAVLSLDPNEGPLNDLEITALLNALRAAGRSNSISLQERAALWLCVALGANTVQYALMCEDDIDVISEDGRRFVQIKVPRIKKRTQYNRAEFRKRKLTDEIGGVLLDLIEQNVGRREPEGVGGEALKRPLFVRRRLRPGSPDAPLADYGWHLYATEFVDLVQAAVRRLNVISPRTGAPLHVTPRRLRYTFATRLVREGASMRDVADALDHTDLQHVRVYFDIKSDIVESLDRAMALALGPVAQAFLGKLVGSEKEAERGDDPRSRIRVNDRKSGRAEAVGTCGQHSFCGLFAPVACYTCNQFQPWMDGPHDLILESLLADRERRKTEGQDGRMVSLHDTTILAIGDVITRIVVSRSGGEA